jgi:hypothetical protein
MASLFTMTMFVLAFSCSAEAFMVGRRISGDTAPDVVEPENSLIGMIITVYGDHDCIRQEHYRQQEPKCYDGKQST